MKHLRHILNSAPPALLLSLAVLPVAQSLAHPATSTFSRPLQSRWPWAHLRDNVVRLIWNVPFEDQLKFTAPQTPIPTSSPPPSLLERYGGDLVLRFEINSAAEARALAEAIDVLFLDVWEFTRKWVDIRLSKDVVRLFIRFVSGFFRFLTDSCNRLQVPSLLGLLPASLKHAHTPLMHDLAQAIFESYPSAIFEETPPPVRDGYRTFSPDLHPSTDETNIFFRNYQPLSVIVPWMRLMSSLFPTHVRMINIGLSYEGRDILALRVGVHPTNSDKPTTPRKTIIITGGSHAREWISTSSVNFVAYSLITAYGKSRSMTNLLEKFDWVFIPTLNPDGYVYTWESDRLWRKNRQQTTLRFCKGVDLDRAYDFEWNSSSSKNNPCSESFSGEGPFQGVESRRFANWVRNETDHNNAEIVSFLDFHSYSQQVLYPYSFSCTSAPPSLENLEELAIGLAKAIRVTTGQTYGVTSACEGSVSVKKSQKAAGGNKEAKSDKEVWPRMETGGGSALDWFYHDIKVRYAYQIKLRDTGSYGFLLPSKDIVPTGKEALSAVHYLGEFLLGNKGIEVDDKDVLTSLEKIEKEGQELPYPAKVEVPESMAKLPMRAVINNKQNQLLTSHISPNADKVDVSGTTEEGKEEYEEDASYNSMSWELKRRRRR